MTEEKKDTIVVAREGYQVLLNVVNQTLDVSCYSPVNLSKIFSQEVINDCHSLHAHLEDGNLIYYIPGITVLPKDSNAPHIEPMRSESAIKLETDYDQEAETISPNMRMKTTVDNITPEIKKTIQKRVIKNRDEILANDQKILEKHKSSADNHDRSNPVAGGSGPLSKEALQLNVRMDISPEEFKKRQLASRKKLQQQEIADHKSASQDIEDTINEENQQDAEINKNP